MTESHKTVGLCNLQACGCLGLDSYTICMSISQLVTVWGSKGVANFQRAQAGGQGEGAAALARCLALLGAIYFGKPSSAKLWATTLK